MFKYYNLAKVTHNRVCPSGFYVLFLNTRSQVRILPSTFYFFIFFFIEHFTIIINWMLIVLLGSTSTRLVPNLLDERHVTCSC